MSLLCIVLNKSSIDECVWALGLEIMSVLIMCSHFHVNHTSANMPRLTEAQRNQVIGILINSSVNEVAQQFNVSRQTIHAIKLKQRQFGTVKDRPGRGRHPVTNAAENRQMMLRHVRNRFLPATETARHFNIGSKTYQIPCLLWFKTTMSCQALRPDQPPQAKTAGMGNRSQEMDSSTVGKRRLF